MQPYAQRWRANSTRYRQRSARGDAGFNGINLLGGNDLTITLTKR
jgi:hypothetical protein